MLSQIFLHPCSMEYRFNFLTVAQLAIKSSAFISRLGSRSDITSLFRLWAQTPASWPRLALVVARSLPGQLLGFLCPWDSSILAVSQGGGQAEQNDTGSSYPTEKTICHRVVYWFANTPQRFCWRCFILSFLLRSGCFKQSELWWYYPVT